MQQTQAAEVGRVVLEMVDQHLNHGRDEDGPRHRVLANRPGEVVGGETGEHHVSRPDPGQRDARCEQDGPALFSSNRLSAPPC